MDTPYKYIRREFLNEDDLVHTSWVLAYVEDSEDGEYSASGILHLADCRRSIRLEFYLGRRAEAKTQSIKKIDLLLETLTEFRTALVTEADLIAIAEAEGEDR